MFTVINSNFDVVAKFDTLDKAEAFVESNRELELEVLTER
jgi:hypothetical protein